MNTNTAIGFEPKLPTKFQIEKTSDRYKSLIRNWRTQKLQVMFAYLNALTYRACKQVGVLLRVRRAQGERKGFHKITGDIKAIALKGISNFNVSIEGVVDQIGNFWGVCVSQASMRKYRYELRDVFGLFWFESKAMPCGDKGNRNARRPPALKNFNLPQACILLEALEEVLVKERGIELEDFPGNAGMCRMVYNALFKGVSSYRRKQVIEDVAVIYQGGQAIYASEMDWSDTELNARGASNWLGTYHLIPDEDGVLPELLY